MKNGTLFLVGLYTLGLCIWGAQSFHTQHPQQILISVVKEDNHIPSEAEAIALLGRLNYSASPDDIEAGATNNAVYLYFNQNFGNVNITLHNPSGNLVYSTVVNTAMQQMVIIPITNYTTGTYTVVLTNTEGYAEGDFEHE